MPDKRFKQCLQWLLSIILLVVIVGESGFATELEKVRLQLPWKHQFEFAGYYAAREKGFYREAGLDVEFLEFSNDTRIIDDVLNDRVEFAVSDSWILVEYLRGKPLKLLANIFKRSPIAIVAHPDIRSPAGLIGKNVMGITEGNDQFVLQRMLDNFNVSIDQLVAIEPSFSIEEFARGEVDALVVFTTNELYELKQRGIKYNLFDPGVYMASFYDGNLFTSARQVNEHADRVRRFTEASLRGWRYALNNQSEIIQLILDKYNSQDKRYAQLEYESNEVLRLINPLSYQIGSVDMQQLELIQHIFQQADIIEEVIEKGELPGLQDFVFDLADKEMGLSQQQIDYLTDNRIFTFCADPDWMPFERISDGHHEGMAADYLALISEKLGIRFQLVATDSWQQSLDFARQRRCDLLSLAMPTPDRLSYMNFTRPYLSFPLVIAKGIDQPYFSEISQAIRQPLGIVKGYAFGELLQNRYPAMELVEYPNIHAGLQAVLENEVSGFIDTLASVGYQIQQNYIGELKIAGKFEENWELGVGVRNDDTQLVDILNKAIAAISAEQHQNFSNKWLSITVESAVDYRFILQLVAGFTLILLGFAWHFVTQHRLVARLKAANNVISQSENRYKSLFRDNRVVELVVDPLSGRIIDANNAALRFYGYALDEFKSLNENDINVLSDDEVEKQKTAAREASRSMYNSRHRLASGEVREVQIYSGPIELNNRQYRYLIVFDVTEAVQLQREKEQTDELLRQTSQKFQALYDFAPLGMVMSDMLGHFIDFNEAFRRITGYQRDELMALDYWQLTPRKFSDAERRQLESLEQTGYYGPYEKQYIRKDGMPVDVSLNGLIISDEHGEPVIWSIVEDISEKKSQTAALEHSARHDALTGLPNRFLLSELMDLALRVARRQNTYLAVLFLDLDGFKAINDQHGHELGDEVLIEIAGRLRRLMRENDLVARLGGDEFIIGVGELHDTDELLPILERLLKELSQPIRKDELQLEISASIGISLYPQQQEIETDTLIRQADQAMYVAKSEGKNRYSFFNTDADALIRQQSEMIQDFEYGLAHDQVLLHYQPRINLQTGDVISVEALVRWQHPDKGLLYPADFLLDIDRNQVVMIRLSEKIFRLALAQLDAWLEQGLRIGMSINVSAHELHFEGFIPLLQALLKKYPRIQADMLELEILETQALHDKEGVTRTLRLCRELGMNIAIDDFGTGYASLSYLNHFPMDTIKIDRSFVRHCVYSGKNLSIVDASISLASAFRCATVAEGVETEEQGALLLSLGCEYAQGYHIARPMPAADLPGWIAGWKQPVVWRNVERLAKEKRYMIYAQIEHTAWIEQLEKFLLNKNESNLPEMDDRHCYLGHWLENEAPAALRSRLEFVELQTLHRELHDYAASLVAGQTNVTQGIARLSRMRDRMLALIRTFD